MPNYEYRCKSCDLHWAITCTIDEFRVFPGFTYCPYCGFDDEKPARVFGFNIKPMMPEHLNSSTGTVVRSERQLKDDLKRASEAATIRTGIEHNFVPVDHGDRKTLGVTDDGLRETYDRRKKLGMPIPDAVKPQNMT